MELDQKTIQKVLSLSDEELTDAVTRIALGLGLDENMLKPYLARADLLRGAVSKITPADLDRAASVLGEDRVRETLGRIEREVRDK